MLLQAEIMGGLIILSILIFVIILGIVSFVFSFIVDHYKRKHADDEKKIPFLKHIELMSRILKYVFIIVIILLVIAVICLLNFEY